MQKLEQSTAEEVEDTFANVRNAKKYKNKKARSENQDAFIEKEKEDFRDKQFYIPYTRGELENSDGYVGCDVVHCISALKQFSIQS